MEERKLPDKYIQMAEAPLPGVITRLAIPGIIVNLISTFYNMVDTFFVSELGTSATAAVGISMALMTTIQAIGLFFGHGAGNFISRQLGAGKYENAAQMAATGFFSAIIAPTLCLTIPGLIFIRPLAVLLGATPTILPFACDYMLYILLGAPFMASTLMLNNLLRFQGSSFYGMIGMASGALLNAVLDPLLIFVFDMGISGAALATMLSQILSFVILLAVSRKKGNISIMFRNFAPSLGSYKEMLRGGVPSLCRQAIGGVSSIYVNHTAGAFGDAAIAASSVVQRVIMFCAMALIGFGQGFQPVCGFNYGAKNFARVKQAFYFSLKVTVISLVVFAGAEFAFAPQIIGWFSGSDEKVLEVGIQMLRFQCVTFPLLSWVVLTSMMLQTIGSVVRASILSLAWQGLFMIPSTFILVSLWGLVGFQLALPLSTLLSFFVAIPLLLATFKNMREQEMQLA